MRIFGWCELTQAMNSPEKNSWPVTGTGTVNATPQIQSGKPMQNGCIGRFKGKFRYKRLNLKARCDK